MPARSDQHEKFGWVFDNSYARLPQSLFSPVSPTRVERPQLAIFNEGLARELGLNSAELASHEGAMIFSGNMVPEGAWPLAQAYAGHQFGHFTNLGDGRAVLLGEMVTADGNRHDLQLKGSGPTPYSRRGDGRAALGPMLREYIIGEAMHGLGIPTTRSLAVTTTGEEIVRDQILPGAVLTRVAASHIRVGTFEYAAAIGDHEALSVLTYYTAERHYPELLSADNLALALFEAVMKRQAELMARWMCVGFVHGVMNTDNMALSGETIDYGPCAFVDTYDPAAVFSSIDRHGRYAFGNQPNIAQWNLARLVEALLPLMDPVRERAIAQAEEALEKFPALYQASYDSRLRSKLGLLDVEDGDRELTEGLLLAMKSAGADFTATFVKLTRFVERGYSDPNELLVNEEWDKRWLTRLQRLNYPASQVVEVMRKANPVVIPRNHRVEEALSAAVAGDFSIMHRLLDALRSPHTDAEHTLPYQQGAPKSAAPYRTYCGT
jgi:uncharacterized protein YdiU (UPF0061 family)